MRHIIDLVGVFFTLSTETKLPARSGGVGGGGVELNYYSLFV